MNFQLKINTCRVCMKSNEGQSLLDDADLRGKFIFTTRLTLTAHDNMPNLICSKCEIRLRVAAEFITLAQQSEKNMKAFLAKISNDFEKVTSNPANSLSIATSSANEDDELLLLMSTPTPTTITTTTKAENRKQTLQITSNVPKENAEIENATQAKMLEQTIKDEILQMEEDFVDDEEAETTYELYAETCYGEVNKTSPKEKSVSDEQQLYIQESLSEKDCDTQDELEVLDEQSQESQMGQLEQRDGYLAEYEAMLENEMHNAEVEYVADAEDQEQHEEEGEGEGEEELHLYEETEELLPSIQEQNVEFVGMQTEEVLEETPATVAVESVDSIIPEFVDKIKTSPRKPVVARNPPKSKKNSTIATSTRFYCVKCNRDFSTKTNLTRHMATHKGNKPYQCSVCSKGFTQNSSLKQHQLTHTGEKPFVCKYCNRGFTQCKSLVFHVRRHTGDKPFQCDTCNMYFRQKDGLRSHILKHHMLISQEDNAETHTCIVCKQSLTDKESLQEHMRKHVNNHRNVTVLGGGGGSGGSASNINATMSNSGNAGNGMIVFEMMDDQVLLNDKPNLLENELNAHLNDTSTHVVDLMATSTDEPSRAKKYQCRKCFKCFAIKKNLIRHLSIHDVSVVELFQCKKCEIAFDTNYALKVHRVRVHKETGINLNECEDCNMVFQTANELMQHNNSVHEYNCAECPTLRFKSQKLLMEHMLEHELHET